MSLLTQSVVHWASVGSSSEQLLDSSIMLNPILPSKTGAALATVALSRSAHEHSVTSDLQILNLLLFDRIAAAIQGY